MISFLIIYVNNYGTQSFPPVGGTNSMHNYNALLTEKAVQR